MDIVEFEIMVVHHLTGDPIGGMVKYSDSDIEYYWKYEYGKFSLFKKKSNGVVFPVKSSQRLDMVRNKLANSGYEKPVETAVPAFTKAKTKNRTPTSERT